jgi:hypothetical protein
MASVARSRLWGLFGVLDLIEELIQGNRLSRAVAYADYGNRFTSNEEQDPVDPPPLSV